MGMLTAFEKQFDNPRVFDAECRGGQMPCHFLLIDWVIKAPFTPNAEEITEISGAWSPSIALCLFTY